MAPPSSPGSTSSASRASHPASARAVEASFVVVLTYRGTFKGMVGPFDGEDEAATWAATNAEAALGWSWTVDPVVSPAGLAAAAPATARDSRGRGHLRLLP